MRNKHNALVNISYKNKHVNKLAALPTAKTHFQWIDILRGLAALAVVFYHVRVDLWVGWKAIQETPGQYSLFERAVAWLSVPTPFMGSGVMLFFILSGFCIHYPDVATKSIKIKSYAIRRLVRILPPYLFAVLFSIGIEWICATYFNGYRSGITTIKKTFLMVQNYPPSPGQLASNPSLWSLPVEMELYLFYPVLFWLSSRVNNLILLGVVTSVSIIATLLTLSGSPWLSGNFAQYWIIWCSGAVLANLLKRNRLPEWKSWYLLPMAGTFVAAVVTFKLLPYAIGHFIWALAYCLVIWFCLSLPAPTNLFSVKIVKPLLWLGKISYSLYLIHFPLFVLLGKGWEFYFGGKPANFLVCVCGAMIAVFIGGVFYNMVEKPFHILARRLGKKPVYQA